ncbi:hypothetical protein [Salinisphaera sp. T31B1]|uniref:hypothetical protein n=1 Tax=Salinisphaera sp. T31B1 TaxID=727963 RepID=UPI00333FDD70
MQSSLILLRSYGADYAGTKDRQGGNGGTLDIENHANVSYSGSQSQDFLAAALSIGGRSDKGNGKHPGGNGGTVTFVNYGNLTFTGSTTSYSPIGNYGYQGVWDDAGIVFGLYAASEGAVGQKGSSSIFDDNDEQNGADGGNGGSIELLQNDGHIRIETAMPKGAVGVFASSEGGSGGEQGCSGFDPCGVSGDQNGGLGGSTGPINIVNNGKVELTGTVSNIFWGIGAESYGGHGGTEAADGGTAGAIQIEHHGDGGIILRSQNLNEASFDHGVAGIKAVARGGHGSQSDDNSDRGGRGGDLTSVKVVGAPEGTPEEIIGIRADSDITVYAEGIRPKEASAVPGNNSDKSLPIIDILAQSGGIVAVARGGDGGNSPDNQQGKTYAGGAGDEAVDGARVHVTTDSNTILTSGDYLHGIFAGARGGDGGTGRGQSDAGGGSNAAAVRVDALANSRIRTDGREAIGIAALSVGGRGGYVDRDSDGAIDIFSTSAGSSGRGGTVGVRVEATDGDDFTIATRGRNSHAIRAQSLGGTGGDANGSFLLVGVPVEGGGGGDGGLVDVTNYGDLMTDGKYAMGVVAQSIGGGGGDVGDSEGLISVAGSAGQGGSASAVNVHHAGRIVTRGGLDPDKIANDPDADTASGAIGILAQSIGGGGGIGGGQDSGIVSVGGDGGGGGIGDDVLIDFIGDSSIDTYGDFAFGVVAQSIGGGGGIGGDAFATDVLFPALAVGGGGADGGFGQTATIRNYDTSGQAHHLSVATNGQNAHGLIAQSLGGGGGSGGNAYAFDLGLGAFSLATGTGGAGGGSPTTIALDDFAITTERGHSNGVLAQSIGGSGGIGGTAGGFDASIYIATAINVGGSGGGGGSASTVSVDLANGMIETARGVATGGLNPKIVTDSHGIVAQSIGGGGGVGGSGAGKSIVKTLTIPSTGGLSAGFDASFDVGGDGASGGDGSAVKVDLDRVAIATHGQGSHGIVAQSIGGGGGLGGTASAKGGAIGSVVQAVEEFAKSVTTPGKLVFNKVKENISPEELEAIPHDEGDPEDHMLAFDENGEPELEFDGNGHDDYDDYPEIIVEPDDPIEPSEPDVPREPPAPDTPQAQHFLTLNFNVAIGGDGGGGGGAGHVGVNLANGSSIETFDAVSHGLLMQSIAQRGGSAGTGNAGALNIGSEYGYNATLSIGGKGGRAEKPAGQLFLDLDESSRITTHGDKSNGVLAQSIGGGGGESQGTALGVYGTIPFIDITPSVDLQIGRTGATGSDGGTIAQLNLDGAIDTYGADADGVFIQSIGGSGGAGGSFGAESGEGGLVRELFELIEDYESWLDFSDTVGGRGGAGGNGGTIGAQPDADGKYTDNNGDGIDDAMRFSGTIHTRREFADGMVLQSIGGGGGVGGAGVAQGSISIIPAFAFGGNGGASGDGHSINYGFDDGAILTEGASAFGVIMQSIGGGGGFGGTASRTRCGRFSLGGGLEYKNFVAEAKKRQADIENRRKDNPYALPSVLFDDDASDDEPETESERCFFDLDGPGAFDGNTGSAGNGGAIQPRREGVSGGIAIQTKGEFSTALLAQSIGAGGGAAITTDNKTLVYPDSVLVDTEAVDDESQDVEIPENITKLDVVLGGDHGSHGDGNTVTLDNQFSIATAGRGAAGIVAQSIGGGGGLVQTVGAAELALGAADASGQGDTVTIRATDSMLFTAQETGYGIIGQSIGGGGGLYIGELAAQGPDGADLNLATGGSADAAGNGGAVSFESYRSANAQTPDFRTGGDHARAITLQSIGGGGGVIGTVNAYGLGPGVPIGLQMGGAGSTGSGGAVSLSPAGRYTTFGDGADAIVAQSIGGGGGIIDLDLRQGSAGGAVKPLRLGNIASGSESASLAGGTIDATFTGNYGLNTDITTYSDQAYGVLLQSIGGGGGLFDYLDDRRLDHARLGGALNGDHSTSASSKIQVKNFLHTLTTGGADAHGFVAQSISGGGGVLRSNAGAAGLSLGQDRGLGADAGSVDLTLGATGTGFRTLGLRAFGIVAQSIGGGGGIASAGDGDNIDALALGSAGGSVANASEVDVTWTQGLLQTVGAGSHGIIAQSIGGGGGIAGNVAFTSGLDANALNDTFGQPVTTSATGAGGPVNVNVRGGVQVSGDGAFGVIAQSIGGGGGLAGVKDGVFAGRTSTSNDASAPVTVSVAEGGYVNALGANGFGVLAQSLGGQSGSIDIDIDGSVSGGFSADASGAPTRSSAAQLAFATPGAASQLSRAASGGGVLVSGGNRDNRVSVATTGRLSSFAGSAVRYIAQSGDGTARLNVANQGVISGDIEGYFDDGRSIINSVDSADGDRVAAVTIDNGRDGRLIGARRYLADVVNRGELVVGSRDEFQTLEIAGNFSQDASGTLNQRVDFANRGTQRITVAGDATLDGTLRISPISVVKNRAVELLTVGGTLGGRFQRVHSTLFDFDQSIEGDALSVAAVRSDIAQQRFGLSEHQAEVAGYLERIFDNGDTSFASVLAAADTLADLSADEFGERLLELSPGAITADAAANFELSRRRLDDLFGCRDTMTQRLADGGCLAARVSVQDLDQDSDAHGVGYDARLYGVSLAVKDVPIADNVTAAAAIGYDNSDFDGNRGYSHSEGDIFHAAAALTQYWQGFSLTGAIGTSYGWHDTERRIDFLGERRTARADHETFSLGGRVRVAYEQPLGQNYVKPFVDVDVVHSQADGFREHGAGELDLRIADSDETGIGITPSLELGTHRRIGETIALTGYVSGGISLSSVDAYRTEATFARASNANDAFVTAVPIANTLGRVSAGLDVRKQDRVGLGLRYDGAYGSGFESHGGSVQFSLSF